MRLLILFSITLFFCCKNVDAPCKKSNMVEDYFMRAIETIENHYFAKKREPNTLKIDGARLFLEIVTGIKSKVKKTNFGVYYSSRSDLRIDLKNWKNWYKENKCYLTIGKLDKIYELYLLGHQLTNSNPYPSDWVTLLRDGIGEEKYE